MATHALSIKGNPGTSLLGDKSVVTKSSSTAEGIDASCMRRRIEGSDNTRTLRDSGGDAFGFASGDAKLNTELIALRADGLALLR